MTIAFVIKMKDIKSITGCRGSVEGEIMAK
jgi:hypothetical protein